MKTHSHEATTQLLSKKQGISVNRNFLRHNLCLIVAHATVKYLIVVRHQGLDEAGSLENMKFIASSGTMHATYKYLPANWFCTASSQNLSRSHTKLISLLVKGEGEGDGRGR